MVMPKVIFREMTLDENIDTIKWAYYENNDSLAVHNFTVEYFPELAVLDENTPKEVVYNKIEEIVTKEYNCYLEKIKSETKRYNDIWQKYNDKYLKLLSDYLKVDLPSIEVIEGKVGLIPVFPRYLDEFSFSVSIGLEDWLLIKSTAHEVLHFVWFEKWQQIHPEITRREYDSPYISWQYSEMVTDPILNNKPFSDIFKDIFIERGYDSFYELKDGDNFVMDILRNIYSEDIPIEEKINKGYEYVFKILNNAKSKNIRRIKDGIIRCL